MAALIPPESKSHCLCKQIWQIGKFWGKTEQHLFVEKLLLSSIHTLESSYHNEMNLSAPLKLQSQISNQKHCKNSRPDFIQWKV